jgi:hypothetical protein
LPFEELNDLYVSSDIIRVMKSRKLRWLGHVSFLGEKRNAMGVLLGKPKKGPLGRSRHRWKGSIKHLEERNRTGGHGLA